VRLAIQSRAGKTARFFLRTGFIFQSRRNKLAAKMFFRKLLKGLMYVPRVIITDGAARDTARSGTRVVRTGERHPFA